MSLLKFLQRPTSLRGKGSTYSGRKTLYHVPPPDFLLLLLPSPSPFSSYTCDLWLHEHIRCTLASGPLHLLSFLPGTLLSWIPACYSLTSSRSSHQWPLPSESFLVLNPSSPVPALISPFPGLSLSLYIYSRSNYPSLLILFTYFVYCLPYPTRAGI